MPTWMQFAAAAPELAAEVRLRLEAHTHLTLATVRRDGAPRISGTEVTFRDDDLWIGSMWEARKAQDLQRDPRFAVHGGSDDPPSWTGDAKVAGVAEEVVDADRAREVNGAEHARSHLFRLEIREASAVRLNAAGDGLEIAVWTPGRGVRRLDRGE